MKESDIRPQHIFEEYLRLAQQDARTYFKDTPRIPCDCPACGAKGEHSFTKSGFDYSMCPACNTLYVDPRPHAQAFARYYTESPSSKYWATTFYKETAPARREKLWRPKSAMIAAILKTHDSADRCIIDIGGGYGIFAEEMQKHSSRPVIIIEPAPHLAKICREKGFSVVEKFLENIERQDLPVASKAFVSFELFEHLYSPKDFLQHLLELMQSDDLFIFTTLSGTGIDIQVLWENSKSVSPPHHLNFFNPESVDLLLRRLGFETLQVTTPEKLDLDIMLNSRNLIQDRFWKTFLTVSDESERNKWQKMIAETGWSSHMMVFCRKP